MSKEIFKMLKIKGIYIYSMMKMCPVDVNTNSKSSMKISILKLNLITSNKENTGMSKCLKAAQV